MAYMCPDSFACSSQLQHSYYWSNGCDAAVLSLTLSTCLVLWSPCWLFSCHYFADHHQMIYILISCISITQLFILLQSVWCAFFALLALLLFTRVMSFTVALAHIFQPHMKSPKLQLYWCCHHYYLPWRADCLGRRWFTAGKDHKDLQNMS